MQPKLTSAEHALGGSLPHKRMEAWKWTDVRGNITPEHNGLAASAVPNLSLPGSVSLSRSAVEHSHDDLMGAIAGKFAGGIIVIDVPAGTDVKTPLEITDLACGHTRIHIKLGKDAKLRVVEAYESSAAGFANTEICF